MYLIFWNDKTISYMSDQFWPIVTVICPTTQDRKDFNERIYKNFMAQDYPTKQFLWDYGDGTVGEKLNRLCSIAAGDVIVRMDSDDQYASNWLTQSVYELLKSEADVVGMSQIYFFDPTSKAVWIYTHNNPFRPWIAGATMCFWKNFWRTNQFAAININEDGLFLHNASPENRVHVHNYIEGFVATVHDGNTSKKITDNITYRRLTGEEEAEFFKKRGL